MRQSDLCHMVANHVGLLFLFIFIRLTATRVVNSILQDSKSLSHWRPEYVLLRNSPWLSLCGVKGVVGAAVLRFLFADFPSEYEMRSQAVKM